MPRRLFPVGSIVLPLLFACLRASSAEPFALKPNDTVVFYGDSITDQRLYTMWTELYVLTRYPSLNVRFVHSGWGGDRVTGGGGGSIETRLTRDVIAYHPSVTTIMLGMNDGGYVNHTSAADTTFYDGYHHIVETLNKALPGLRITVIGPSPYDDVTRPVTLQPGGYNAVLAGYADYLKKYADEAHLHFADLNTGVVAMLAKANVADPAMAQKIIPDRVHPASAGHLIMAEALLKSWHARPLVSSVTVDANSGKVTDTQFAKVTEFHAAAPSTAPHLTWTETEEALPLPFAALSADKLMDLAIRSSDISVSLNQEPLIISALSQGRYSLSIDGAPAGTFSEAEWAAGVNLANLDTPMAKQALKVRDLTVQRLDVHQARWRTLQVPLSPLDLLHLDEALNSLDKVEDELTTKQRQAALPLPHKFDLVAAQ